MEGGARHQAVVDVHVILYDNHGRILLGRRRNTGFADGLWHLPAGHVEAHESISAAAAREALEEIGVAIAPPDLQFLHVMHSASGSGRVAFFFGAEKWHGTPRNLEPQKCSELGWFTMDEMLTDMTRYLCVALEHISNGIVFSEFGW